MYKANEPFITSKYPIEVPTHLYYSTPCVYKLIVGSKFYIGKCQSLPQSMTQIATLIERAVRTRNNDESGWFYHVIRYAIQNRVFKARVERMHEEVKEFNWELLKLEHELLTKHRDDENCLNNNFDVYIPKWIKPDQVALFNQWKENEAKKSNRSKNRPANPRKKHKGGQLAVRSNRRVPTGVRPKKGVNKPAGKGGKKSKP